MLTDRRIATSDLDEILEHAGPDIRHFDRMKVFLPRGFVGEWIGQSIFRANARLGTHIGASWDYDTMEDADAIVWGSHSAPPSTDTLMLYLSSGAVYTPDHRRDIAIEKIAGEAICMGNANTKIARLFSFIGPYVPTHYASTRILGGEAAENPTLIRSFLYPTDMVIQLWAIFARGKPREAYDVGSRVPTTLGELEQRVSIAEAVRRTRASYAT